MKKIKTLNIEGTLAAMQTGDKVTFTMREALSTSVRAAASRIKKRTGKEFKVVQSKKALKIDATRTT